MRKLLILCLCLTASAFAQISGAGQLGCNGAPVTGSAWTSATAGNTAQILGTNVTGAQVLVTIDQTTTLTLGAVTFQGDPGDGTFVTLASWQIVDPTIAPFATIANPYTLQASTNKQFLVLMGGMSRLQLKLTTAITGSGSITPFTTLVCYQLPLAFQNTNTNLNVSATFPSAQAVTQSAGPWTENITQFGSSVVVTGTGTGGAGIPRVTVSNDSNVLATQSGNWIARTVGNAGGIFDFVGQNATQPANSILAGCEFNTTPTTLTTGNASPCQLDSAANLLVNLKTSLPTGANVIGALSANQSVNVNQVAGSAVATSATGVQKVGTVGNAGATLDAAAGATAATNSVLHGAVYNTTKPTPTSGQQEPVQADSYSNVYVNANPYPAVQLAQAVNNKVSAGAGTTLTNAFGSSTVAGNSILCIGFEGVAATPVFTDAQGNTYVVAISSGAAAPGYSVALASNIVGGTTDTITLTTSSGSASFSCYELKGAVTVGQAWDYAAPAQATSATLVFPQESAAIANDFVAVGVGMAAGTINATPALAGGPSNLTTVDQSNTAPLGTAALAVYYSAHANVSNSPTFTQSLSLSASETYSAVLVAVKPVSISLVGNVQDPCQQGAGTSGNISLTASGQLITGTAGKLTYICGMNLMTATAQNIALVEGTGATCGTGTAGMAGGATAATGWNFGVNSGFVNGGGGFWVFKTATPGNNVCLLLSGAGQTSGSYRQVQQ